MRDYEGYDFDGDDDVALLDRVLNDEDGDEDEDGPSTNGGGNRLRSLGGLDTASIKIAGGKAGDDTGGNTFSAIIKGEQTIDMSIVWNYTRNYRPQSLQGRMIVNNLTSAGRRMMKAAVNLRKFRFTAFETEASTWTSKIPGKNRAKELEAMEQVLLVWTRGMNTQLHIRTDRLTHGLDAVEGRVVDWYQAERDMREAEAEAIKNLGTAAYQVFINRCEQHRILREEAEDRAKRLVFEDLSEWLSKVRSGDAPLAEIAMGAPWMIQEASIFAMEHQAGENPYWTHLERLQAGAVAAQQARRNRWFNRNAQNSGDGGNDQSPAQSS